MVRALILLQLAITLGKTAYYVLYASMSIMQCQVLWSSCYTCLFAGIFAVLVMHFDDAFIYTNPKLVPFLYTLTTVSCI